MMARKMVKPWRRHRLAWGDSI